MKRFIKNNLKVVVAFILGIIVSGIAVYAISADQITYNNTTVAGALNDLYNKKWNITLLGTDTYDSTYYYAHEHTYDVSEYPNYQNFTEDNFFVEFNSMQTMQDGNTTVSDSYPPIQKSYNSSTGILTVTLPRTIINGYGSIVKLDTYLIHNL